MAMNPEQWEGDLKYLGFFQVAAIRTVICVSSLYEYAKENSGPLRSGVDAVEGTVKAVVGPVYQKLKPVPSELLFFLDKKVDETAAKLDEYVPLPVKQVSGEALGAAQKVPEVAKSFVSEVKQEGVVVAGKSFYAKYEPLAVDYVVRLYHALYALPLFPKVAGFVIPIAAHWSGKYNQTISRMALAGYPLFCYLPLVPVDKIAETFEEGKTKKKRKKKKKEAREIEGVAAAESSG